VADIVVYGGELAGVAAALTAARRADPGTRVTLVFPEGLPGGMATVGSHCGWEIRQWLHNGRRATPQGGSFARWLQATGPIYSPGAFAALLSDELAEAGVTVLAGHELEAVHPRAAEGARAPRSRSRKARNRTISDVGAIAVRAVDAAEGPVLAEGDPLVLSGDLFVDGSATGRLLRLAGGAYSVGRSDWNPDGRQMVASLLVAVEGLDWEALTAARDGQDRPVWGTATEEGPGGTSRTFWGGAGIAANDAVLASFAAAHPGFRVGPPRGWEEAPGTFWISALLVYSVDGRRRAYDAGTDRDLDVGPVKTRDLDTAYQEAVSIATSSDMLGALRRFPGLGTARLAVDGERPRCAATLLLRETIHGTAPGPEPFAVKVEDMTGAGSGPSDGIDSRHHNRRIGLGFYWPENAGYTHGEVVRTTAAAPNPTYLPLDALLVPPLQNVLVPGYAARIESRAWWALRATPNQCVLGDAAGAAAALSLHEGVPLLRFATPEVAALHSWLTGDGVILNKW
jgi:hypothetical protein